MKSAALLQTRSISPLIGGKLNLLREYKRGDTEEQKELEECCGELLNDTSDNIQEDSIVELNQS